MFEIDLAAAVLIWIKWAVPWKTSILPCWPKEDTNQLAHPSSSISLCCPHEDILHSWLFKMRTAKILIRLRKYAVWSESSLAHMSDGTFSNNALRLYCIRTQQHQLWQWNMTAIKSPIKLIIPAISTEVSESAKCQMLIVETFDSRNRLHSCALGD